MGIALVSRADTNSWNRNRFGNRSTHIARHHLDQNRKRACGFKRFGTVDQALCIFAPALDTKAAQLMFELWREADVGHDRYA
ncbi:hypothetical protein D3C78_1808100 [compost metagenome]